MATHSEHTNRYPASPRALTERSIVPLAAVFLFAWAAAAPSAAAEYVIHISVDGLHPGHMQEVIDAGDAPTLARLTSEGAWTPNARTDTEHTNTIPNHTAMLTGRPVDQPEGLPATVHHGYTNNSSPRRSETLHNGGNPNVDYIASVFDVAHDAGLSTALYASKDKFIIYEQSYNEEGGAEHELGRDKIDLYYYEADGPPAYSETMHRRFLSDMAERHFRYTFIHYRDPDTAGHAAGWGSPIWKAAVKSVDNYLADVVRLIETDAALAGRTAVIITTDHGGVALNHGDSSQAANYTIPVIVWGAGVGRGDLYAMNRDSRSDPGTEQIPFAAPRQPIRNGDTGNLALKLLGLPAIPASLINRLQDLSVRQAGDFNGDGAVNMADFILWRETQGSTVAAGTSADGNGDGKVDQADYDLWRANSGTSP